VDCYRASNNAIIIELDVFFSLFIGWYCGS